MSKATMSKRRGRIDPEAAVKAIEAAQAYIRKHGSPFKGMTKDQIIARIKRTREELVRERFGHLFG